MIVPPWVPRGGTRQLRPPIGNIRSLPPRTNHDHGITNAPTGWFVARCTRTLRVPASAPSTPQTPCPTIHLNNLATGCIIRCARESAYYSSGRTIGNNLRPGGWALNNSISLRLRPRVPFLQLGLSPQLLGNRTVGCRERIQEDRRGACASGSRRARSEYDCLTDPPRTTLLAHSTPNRCMRKLFLSSPIQGQQSVHVKPKTKKGGTRP